MYNAQTPVNVLKENLTKYVPKFMHEHNVPGLALAMFKGQDIILNLEFGVKNTVTKEPVDETTIFEGASFTKPLISYAALKMCQQGLMSLDKPLRDYLSHPYKSDPPYLKDVTMRHVLYHNTGMPLRILARDEPLEFLFRPGSEYFYSSSSYNYLYHVMEHILGNRSISFLKQQILEPMGMSNTSFKWEPQFETLAASPHNRKSEPVQKWKPKQVIGAASVHTTPVDYAKFMISVLQQAKKPDFDNINMLDEQFYVLPNIYSALGWAIEKTPVGEVVYHVGNNLTFRALAVAYRESEFGVIFMTNSMNSYKMFEKILNVSIGGNHRSMVEFEEFETEDDTLKDFDDESLAQWWRVNTV